MKLSSLDTIALKNEEATISRKLRNRELSLAFINIYSLVEGTFSEALKEAGDTWRENDEALAKIDSMRTEIEQKLASATNIMDRVYYKAKLNVLDEIVELKVVA